MLGKMLYQYLINHDCRVFTCGRDDICDIQYDMKYVKVPTIPAGLNIDIIFHCASAFADDSLSGCIHNEQINALSSYIVGEIASITGCKHLIYAGSISSCLPSSSSTMTSYGASKLRAEDILEWSLTQKKIAFTSLRFPQLYDVHGECCKHQMWLGRIVAYAYAGQKLRMPGGNAKRNFLHIDDAVCLMHAAMKNTVIGRLTLSHPVSLTTEEIAKQAYDIFNNGGFYEIASEKPPFRDVFIPESTNSFELLKYQPHISICDGLTMIKSSGSAQKFGPMDVI